MDTTGASPPQSVAAEDGATGDVATAAPDPAPATAAVCPAAQENADDTMGVVSGNDSGWVAVEQSLPA
eukprot:9953727-Lingulodinium_polyedra.AAC.1